MELMSLKLAVTLLIVYWLMAKLDQVAIDVLGMNSNARTVYCAIGVACFCIGIFFALVYVWSLP